MVNLQIEDGSRCARDGMTLPQPFFISDEIFTLEKERLFHASWFCVGRRDQLSRPGDYFLAEVASENLIVNMDAEGNLRAMFNVCRHRGSRMVADPSGNFAHCRIRCPYHRWTYECDGTLLAAPNMPADFLSEEWPLTKVAIADWQGFVFVNLAESPDSIEKTFEPFWSQLDPWRTAELRVAHQKTYELNTNWKMVFQNFNECYHCLSVHPGLDKLSPVSDCDNDFWNGVFLGGPMQLAAESMTTDGRRTAPTIKSLDEKKSQRVFYYTLLPNMLFAMHPDFVLAWRIQPQGPGQTTITAQWLYEPEAIEKPTFNPQPAIDFWDRTNNQDWEICQRSYAGVQSKAYQPGRWSTSELIPQSFDRSVLSALGLLDESNICTSKT